MVAIVERGRASERPSLLFVHGALHGSWAWEEHFLDFFADRGWHAVALDLRGHGNTPSRGSVTWVSIKAYLADVAEVADSMVRPPVLVGHSLGGFVVQRYLENHAVPAAVLMGSTPPGGALRLTLRAARRSPLATLRVFGTFKLLPLFGSPAAARYWFFRDDMPDELVQRYVARLQEESFRAVLDTLVRPVRTRRISTPVLVIGGDLDRTATSADQRITAASYHVEAVVLPGLPHDLMLDRDWRSAAVPVERWIEQAVRAEPEGGST